MAFDDGVKTVSGSVAHTDDAAAKVPFVSVKCGIEPTLSGVSEVTETQTGRNLLDVPAREELTRNGVISSVASDGTITASGQSTGNGDIPITLGTSANLIGGQTYTFSINGTDTRTGSVYVYFAGGSYISINNANHSGTYTPSADQTITGVTLRMFNGQSITLSAKIMLEIGSTAHDYEPYQTPTTYTASLGRTIYGGQADIVNGEGESKNGLVTDFSTLRANGTSTSGAYRYIMDVSGMGDYNVGACISNLLNYRVSWNADVGEFYNTANVLVIFLSQDNETDAINYLTSNSCKVAYPLATPTDFTFTPITPTPETVGKVNNVYCDTGDTEVTYHDNAHGFSEVTVNKTGKNLFDKNAVTNNTWIVVDGTATESATGYRTSSYIPVKANTRYYVSTKSSNRSAYYDKNGNGIAYFAFSGGTSFNSLYDGYIRITIKNDIDLDTFVVNEGSEAIPYEPFGIGKTAYLHKVIYGGKADVIRGTCEPKNLIELYTRASHNGVNYSINADGSLHREGTASPSTSFNNGNAATYSACPYKLSKGTYTITVRGNQASGGYLSLGMRKTDDTQLTSIAVTGNTSKTFTVDEDVGAWYWISLPNGVSANDDIYIQLEKGSESTEHAPYFEPFSFPPISMSTDEGENTLFANEGDSAITYRKAVD